MNSESSIYFTNGSFFKKKKTYLRQRFVDKLTWPAEVNPVQMNDTMTWCHVSTQ